MWSKMYIGLHVKYTLFLSDFNETWIFLLDFRNILNFMKILTVAFHNLTNAPNKSMEPVQLCDLFDGNWVITNETNQVCD